MINDFILLKITIISRVVPRKQGRGISLSHAVLCLAHVEFSGQRRTVKIMKSRSRSRGVHVLRARIATVCVINLRVMRDVETNLQGRQQPVFRRILGTRKRQLLQRRQIARRGPPHVPREALGERVVIAANSVELAAGQEVEAHLVSLHQEVRHHLPPVANLRVVHAVAHSLGVQVQHLRDGDGDGDGSLMSRGTGIAKVIVVFIVVVITNKTAIIIRIDRSLDLLLQDNSLRKVMRMSQRGNFEQESVR